MLAQLVRLHLRSPLRGRTRLTLFLARRFRPLQEVPVQVAGCHPVYVDLRDCGTHDLWRGSPWPGPPREAAEQRVMQAIVRPGDVAYDVGANLGFHTTFLNRLVNPGGLVAAFEPNPALPLRRTAAGMPGTKLFPVALSNRCGEASLFVPKDATIASLEKWQNSACVREYTCRTETLDSLVAGGLPAPDFIKCDVEGAEPLVFEGARDTLDRAAAPLILFEANVHAARGFGNSVSAGKDFLAGLSGPRFRFFEVTEAGPLPRLEAVNPVHSNILAVPESRLDRIAALQG